MLELTEKSHLLVYCENDIIYPDEIKNMEI